MLTGQTAFVTGAGRGIGRAVAVELARQGCDVALPEPEGFRDHAVAPTTARFADSLGEFVLPYEVVRTVADPDAVLLEFLHSTYAAAADTAAWNRTDLER